MLILFRECLGYLLANDRLPWHYVNHLDDRYSLPNEIGQRTYIKWLDSIDNSTFQNLLQLPSVEWFNDRLPVPRLIAGK